MPKKPRQKPGPVDLNASANLYAIRCISQQNLADTLGISYQQIQKYEKGANRMTASTLYRIALALDIPILTFFAGLDGMKWHGP